MWNEPLPRRAPPLMRPSYPADRARLLFLRTCALEVSHELCRKAKLPLRCFGIFEPAANRMWNEPLPRRAPPLMRPSYPADRARLLFLRTCALEVSHELCRKAKLPLRRTP